MGNKIKYNLKNVHVALLTENGSSYSYDTPHAIPGAVNLSLDAEGEDAPFYADGIVYFRAVTNNGYSGEIELAMVPDWFREYVLQEEKDTNSVFVEKNNITSPQRFALLFEFDGDVNCIRHVLYYCAVSTRPALSSRTKEASIEPGTETLTISADPRPDGLIKSRTGDSTSGTVYNAWYDSVYLPTSTPATLASLSIGSLTLSPSFSSTTTAYTASTSNATDTVSAVGASGTTVSIKVNGTTHTSGTAATWNAGSNTIAITVSKSGFTTTTYTVTVTKS